MYTSFLYQRLFNLGSRQLLFAFFVGFIGFSLQASASGFHNAADSRQEQMFNDLREKAKRIDDLSSFLRNYVGDCEVGAEASACRRQSVVFRQQANQSSHVFFAFEDAVALEIRPLSGDQFSIAWLPFFSAFGYGLSSHPPKQWNKDGLPIYSFMQLRGQLPMDSPIEEIVRWNKFGRLAAEVIVVPKGIWKAAAKGKVPLEGVKVSWKAIRIFDSRSGQTLGVWIH